MDLKEWLGRCEESIDTLTPTPYAAMSATLDRPADRPANGVPLPALWHWLYFLPVHRQSEIGADGHAKRGGFLPPVPLPRRMWAASQFEFHQPLRIGDTVSRLSTIDDITEKNGRSGRLVFVKVRHDLRRVGESELAVREFHEIVYRDLGEPEMAPPPPRPTYPDPVWRTRWLPDEVLLFRYSALTFNGHRIHYDRRYVTEVEGYPGLVVHGPLLATLLVDLLRHRCPDAELTRFEFRALRPTFDGQPFFVNGTPQPDGKQVHLWAEDHQGWLTMDATATLK